MDRNHLCSSALHMCCCVLGQESSLWPNRDSEDGQESCVCRPHAQMVWTDRNVMAACLCGCWGHSASRCMATLRTGHTEKIPNFYFVWGSKALLVVKGNALSTLPSSSYHAGFCLDSKMKARHKKNNTGFVFLLYAPAFKINFRRSRNSLEVSLCVFLKVAINTVYIMQTQIHWCIHPELGSGQSQTVCAGMILSSSHHFSIQEFVSVHNSFFCQEQHVQRGGGFAITSSLKLQANAVEVVSHITIKICNNERSVVKTLAYTFQN